MANVTSEHEAGDVLHATTLEVAAARTNPGRQWDDLDCSCEALGQPKNFQTAGQHTRPLATDVQIMNSCVETEKVFTEHVKLSARSRRHKKAWRHTGSALDVLQMSTPRGNFKDVRFYPLLNFGLFGAALLQMSVFYPTRNFRQFWAPSLVTLLTFPNAINFKHPEHPKHPKHPKTP